MYNISIMMVRYLCAVRKRYIYGCAPVCNREICDHWAGTLINIVANAHDCFAIEESDANVGNYSSNWTKTRIKIKWYTRREKKQGSLFVYFVIKNIQSHVLNKV